MILQEGQKLSFQQRIKVTVSYLSKYENIFFYDFTYIAKSFWETKMHICKVNWTQRITLVGLK